jgi:NHL repeat-containing protein
VLPQLREIEHQFADAVVGIGVHSGKYIAERETPRIREAAARLDAHHPIVNDRQYRIWRSYAVRAWPTLVVIDPKGIILGTHAGEFTADALAPFLQRAIDAYAGSGELDRTPRSWPADPPARTPGTLRYPGKVAVGGDRLAIADSGHHRVIVGRLEDGGRRLRVEQVIGGGERGFADAPRAGDARFDGPQGLAFARDALYVADTGNHAVRRIALGSGAVGTLAGIGRQLRTQADLEQGALSSPWDLALAGTTLFVAMAGTHQLYAIDTSTGALRAHCGSGAEELHDGPNEMAALAQPMGIAVADDRIYFVDAEASAVRWADVTPRGQVHTVIGTGLFDFGDRDGTGDEVRMEHQQGIAVHSDGRLLVADTYSDALKWVDPATRTATTWLRGFAEPSGVAIAGRLVYVADQTAHRIAVAHLDTGAVDELEVVGL